MKGILEFNLEESFERSAHKRAVNATNAYMVIHAVGQEVFRPARKHGYEDEKDLNLLLNGPHGEYVAAAIHMLERKFYKLVEDHGINLDDLE